MTLTGTNFSNFTEFQMFNDENKLLLHPIVKSTIVNLFHRLYYASMETWPQNTFLGYPIWQCPMDLQIYQELVVRKRPKFIIQTGVKYGGSILYFASLLDLIGSDPSAIVVGVDIELSEQAKTLKHARIRLVEGSSTDPAVVDKVRSLLPEEQGMVILDSDHHYQHVLDELTIYRQFVGLDHYLVAEDTNINGRPVFRKYGPGPFEAVTRFLDLNQEFTRDNDLWKGKLFSFHQCGWMKRVNA
jgi:cephalosporin hydroxylase